VSGVARISKDLILNTADRFDWVQLAAKQSHEEDGQIIDISKSIDNIAGTTDAYVRLYANTGYGDEVSLKRIIKSENPNAILHITDPRYWGWLYAMERHIRQTIPICYYHVWDNDPPPSYNEGVYKSCDWIGCISKLTHKVVNAVDVGREDWQTPYIPHGVCPITFSPVRTPELDTFKQQIFGEQDYTFVILSNNVNIPRKQLPTIISAYAKFGDSLPTEDQKNILLVMHTNPQYASGTDLHALAKDMCPKHDIVFSNTILDDTHLNYLYNISDVTINIASNEGFGLSTLESMMAGTPIIISKTGGLVDQAYESEHTCGKWCSVIEPKVRTISGSQQVPYIYSDICSEESVVNELRTWHDTPKETRDQNGTLGRAYAKEYLTTQKMCERVASGLMETMENFKPKDRVSLIKI
jgi:glycosyltransferase involved in cell wall biosynthesis